MKACVVYGATTCTSEYGLLLWESFSPVNGDVDS